MKGPDPVDNAGERRIPRGGSLQESGFRVWPAAIDPQTPTVPGAKRPPGFGHRGGGTKGPAQLESPITKRPGMMKTPEGARHNYTGAWAWEGSGVAGSRVPPLRWVISPSSKVRHKAATIRTGEGISLAGKM